MSDEPPKTVTTTTAFAPVSPLAVSKWLAKGENGTQFPGLPTDGSEPKSPVTVCDDSHDDSNTCTDTDSNPTQESPETMPARCFSPSNGIDSLILAATDSMRDDDSTSSAAQVSNEDQDTRSLSSSSSNGRKLRTWQESFQALLRFKEKEGHCQVPVRYSDDSALANWVRYQQRNQDTLPEDKRKQLETVGFQFGARNDRQWETKFQRLKEYQEKFGRHAIIRDMELSQWVSTQRSLFKKDLLRSDRQQKLDAIGFVWQANQKHVDSTNYKSGATQSRRDAQWRAQFERLQEFYREHGHFRVPNHYDKDFSLGIWVSNQRSIHNRGQLPEDRKALLDSIGFVWRVEAKEARASLYQKQWEQQLEALIQYKLLHGNCDVPANFEKKGLGVWVTVQKEAGRKGTLEPTRAERLLSTGLTWGDERETCWTRSFVKLQGYLVAKSVGTVVSFDEISSFDSKLGHWIKLQCVLKKHEKLPLKRAFLMENIGCKWNEKKMIVAGGAASSHTDAQLQEESKMPSIPYVPDFASSGPITRPSEKAPSHVKRDIIAVSRSIPLAKMNATKRQRPPTAQRPATAIPTNYVKRHISSIHGASRRGRGRDPPGDPPGKRVKLAFAEGPIPAVVRSDPPGEPPCEVRSIFTL